MVYLHVILDCRRYLNDLLFLHSLPCHRVEERCIEVFCFKVNERISTGFIVNHLEQVPVMKYSKSLISLTRAIVSTNPKAMR